MAAIRADSVVLLFLFGTVAVSGFGIGPIRRKKKYTKKKTIKNYSWI